MTDEFVFVLQDGVLYKFEITSLGLRGMVRLRDLDPAAAPSRRAAGVEGRSGAPRGGGAGGRQSGDALQSAVRDGLTWLAAHQGEDGRWDADGFMSRDRADGPASDGPGRATNDVGVTGLATLALLGSGSTLRTGPHRDAIKRAVVWLREQQGKDGLIGTDAAHDFIYGHAIATLALSEAYGLSKYALLRAPAQAAVNYLERHRNPYGVWRYRPRDNDSDTSVTTWAWLACASAKDHGLEVNGRASTMVAEWYEQVTDSDGRAGYSERGQPSSRLAGDHATRFPPEKGEALTAAALFGRLLLGQTPATTPIMLKSADLLLAKPPRWEAGAIDPYYWWFGTMAMYQLGGRWWQAWSPGLGAVVDAQRHDGNLAGSWDPIGVWDCDGGRVYATALHVLTLQARGRYAQLLAAAPDDRTDGKDAAAKRVMR